MCNDHTSYFLIHISLQSDGLYLYFFKLNFFDPTLLIVLNIKGKHNQVAPIQGLENYNLWSLHNFFSTILVRILEWSELWTHAARFGGKLSQNSLNIVFINLSIFKNLSLNVTKKIFVIYWTYLYAFIFKNNFITPQNNLKKVLNFRYSPNFIKRRHILCLIKEIYPNIPKFVLF